VAAAVGYQNLKSRWDWGAQASQIPYVRRSFSRKEIGSGSQTQIQERDARFWEIDRELTGITSYPFNRVQRVELTAGYRNIDFSSEEEVRTFTLDGELLSDITRPLPEDTLKSLHLATAGAALVYDSSIFGGTSPLLGQSYRFEAAPIVGDLQFVSALGDYRRYVMLARPLSLAGRVLHYGRYGRDAENNLLAPLFLGYPTLIRGYDDGSFTSDECSTGDCVEFDRLFGSRLAVANLELRLPLFGAIGVVPSPGVPPIETALFFDAGSAWTEKEGAEFLGGSRSAVTSHGAALRINLFGYVIGEVAFVHPNDRPRKGWYWQFSFQPGF